MRGLLFGITSLIAAGSASAQQNQTADGAQKFLATLISRGPDVVNVTFVNANGESIPLKGTETFHSAWIRRSGGKEYEETAYKHQPDPKVTAIEKNMGWMLGVDALDAVNADGKADACVTRISKIHMAAKEVLEGSTVDENTFPEKALIGYKDSPIRWYHSWKLESPLEKFAAPHYIDWSKAKVSRTADGRVYVNAPGPNFRTLFVLVPNDPELSDRIEYAAKFLQMSCDKSASTGF